jgi:hypothetical protein
MAVTVTPVLTGPNIKSWTVIADADADTTATITHGFNAAPEDVTITPIHAAARVSLWVNTVVDGTNITCTKATTAGSGNAAAQLLVTARRPHSIVK